MGYLEKSISALHELLIQGKATPLELAQEAIAKAKANQDNAFEIITEKEALDFASTLTEPEASNPLWGIPFVLKDNFSTKGIETTASSNILNGYVPLFDATVYAKLKEKKAVLIGKATMDELAMGGTGTTGHKGTTYNPWDPSHTRLVGGSSCGSAASVAAGIVPFSLGSDTGDSVRKPASFAGLVGMKPTWGRISRYGLFPFAPSLDHVGYFTRNVGDAAILLDVLAGRDPHDATSSFRPVEAYEPYLYREPKGLKVAVLKEVYDSLSDKRLKDKVNASLAKLKEMGVEIDFVEFGYHLLSACFPTYIVISCAEATSNDANLDGIKFGPYYPGKTYQEVMFNARTNGFSELIKRRFVIGSFSLMRENQDVLFRRAQKARGMIVARVNEILADHDFIFAPAAPGIAPKFTDSSDKLSSEYLIADNHLCLGNFAGLPSMTLPLGLEDDMPLGVNFMGRAFEEGKLFQIASAYEKITGLSDLSVLNRKEGNL